MEAGLALAAGVGNLYSLAWGAMEGRMSTTPPKFNSEFTPEKLPKSNRKGSSSNHYFSGSMLNFGGVSICYQTFRLSQDPQRRKIVINTSLDPDGSI